MTSAMKMHDGHTAGSTRGAWRYGTRVSAVPTRREKGSGQNEPSRSIRKSPGNAVFSGLFGAFLMKSVLAELTEF